MPKIGRKLPEGTKSEVQSVLFDVNKWTISEAKKWLKEHDFTRLTVDKTENKYRFRQYDPELFKRFKTISGGDGIQLVIGFVKEEKSELQKYISELKKFTFDNVEIDFDNLELYMNAEGFNDEEKNLTSELLSNFDLQMLNKIACIVNEIGFQSDQKKWELKERIKLVKQESEREKNKKAQEARSKRYKIAIKDDTNVTKPGKWKNLSDSEFGDPVNYKFPIHDASHTRNAQSRFNQEATKKQYSSSEIKVIQDRIDKAKKKFKIGEFKKSVRLIKETANDEERLVYGVVIEPGNIDTDKQWTDEQNIKNACHNFMKYFQEFGLEHEFIDVGNNLKLVENFIAPTNFVYNGTLIKKGSWIMAHYVEDDEVWEQIKSGELDGYSFEGLGILVDQKPN